MMLRRLTVLAFALGSVAYPGAAQGPAPIVNWYRGNLHTHTINSDGDSSPWDLVAWYKRNGYQFLAITDHNTFTDPADFDSNPNDNFLLLGAEEVTNEKTVHVNAIGISRVIPPQRGPTVTDILQASIDAVRAQGAVALINHPNFRWAFTAREMLPLKGPVLLEIASGHPTVNHSGDGLVPPTEQMWDELLSSGMRVFGVAVDDAHNFRQEFTVDRANPGRGWVVVRAPSLTREAIVAALTAGEFYASSGVELKNVVSTSDALSVEIQTASPIQSAKRYRVVFIGKNGRELATSQDNPARYAFNGSEGYVRARVEDSAGLRAWTQPVFVGSIARASQNEDFAVLEREAAQALRYEKEPFSNLAPLVARLHAGSVRAPDAAQRGRLGLLWLRSVRSLLATIPFDAAPDEHHRAWLERHESVVMYSEPAGQWLIVPEVVWRVHDTHKSTPSAEAIAWFAVENGYPGECEGYIPCYANVMNWLDGEYLRRHPRGGHASEAVAQVRASLVQAVKLLAGKSPEDSLNPRTDCGDLKAGLVPLRAAVLASNAAQRKETVGVIDELLARCR